jgi:hypothetical protein
MDQTRTISRKDQRALRKWAWLLKAAAALGRRSARRRRQALRDLRRSRGRARTGRCVT